jgi:hypothetical protein
MKNVEKHLAEPIVSSCLVTPKGAAAGAMAGAVLGAGGSIAKAAADTAAGQFGNGKAPIDSDTASVAMLALTADDVVLLNGRRGMLKPVATGLAGRAPRRELAVAELGKGNLVAPLRLAWTDGTEWQLNVPRAEAKKAQALVDQLTAG